MNSQSNGVNFQLPDITTTTTAPVRQPYYVDAYDGGYRIDPTSDFSRFVWDNDPEMRTAHERPQLFNWRDKQAARKHQRALKNRASTHSYSGPRSSSDTAAVAITTITKEVFYRKYDPKYTSRINDLVEKWKGEKEKKQQLDVWFGAADSARKKLDFELTGGLHPVIVKHRFQIDLWRARHNVSGTGKFHTCSVSLCKQSHLPFPGTRRTPNNCHQCKILECRKSFHHPCLVCKTSCHFEHICNDIFICMMSGALHFCDNASSDHNIIVHTESRDWICAISGYMVETSHSLVSESVNKSYDENPYTGDVQCGTPFVAETFGTDHETTSQSTLNHERHRKLLMARIKRASKKRFKRKKVTRSVSKMDESQHSSPANTSMSTTSPTPSFVPTTTTHDTSFNTREQYQLTERAVGRKVRSATDALSKQAKTILFHLLCSEARKKNYEEAIVRRDEEVHSAIMTYGKTCFRKRPVVKPEFAKMRSIQLDVYNSRRVPPPLVDDENAPSRHKLKSWIDLIMREWALLLRTKAFRESCQNINKAHFVLGMLYWMTHGLTDSGFKVINKDPDLRRVMPVSRDLVKYGHQEGDMTRGRTLISELLNKAKETMAISQLCL